MALVAVVVKYNKEGALSGPHKERLAYLQGQVLPGPNGEPPTSQDLHVHVHNHRTDTLDSELKEASL